MNLCEKDGAGQILIFKGSCSMRRQPVFPGAFFDEDGDVVGEWQGGFHDVEDFRD